MTIAHPTEAQVIAASYLAAAVRGWVEAYADDREPPELMTILGEERPSIEALELCRVVLGVEDKTANKVRMMRFLAAICDLLARDGSELQALLHNVLRPDEPRVVVLVVPEEIVAELDKIGPGLVERAFP